MPLNTSSRAAAVALLVAALSLAPVHAYRIALKDGSVLAAKEKYHIEGDRALIVLESGAMTSIPASEIDVERTNALNQELFGRGTTIIEGANEGAEGEAPAESGGRSISDLLGRAARDPGPDRTADTSTPALRRTASGAIDLERLPREKLANESGEQVISETLREHGIHGFDLWTGSARGRVLIDLVAENRTDVLAALEDLASTYVALQQEGAAPAALEVFVRTSQRQRAAMITLDADNAPLLAKGRLEPGEFFVQYVAF